MTGSRSSTEGVSLGKDETELSFEAESGTEQAIRQVTKRWKIWVTIAVTTLTTWFLYGINDTWTKDATAFAIFTVGILAYTLVTLYSDVEML